MRYLLVTPGYPSESKKYNNAFVHARVKQYIKAGLEVDIFSYSKSYFAKPGNGKRYKWENVEVECGNLNELSQKLRTQKYDKILMHFAIHGAVKRVLTVAAGTPVIIWCHGVDVISWRRRMYNLRIKNIVKFCGYAVLNTIQRMYIHRAVMKYGNLITFVFVSNWLKNCAQRDLWLSERLTNFRIIPNIIDEVTFQYKQKEEVDRLKILSIRSFDFKKYANDLTVKAVKILSDKDYFNELEFTICGKGRLWDRTTAPLKQYSNVELINQFFSHDEIVDLHAKNGIMLMPSRQDTQGVSTCEGMSSGLVPISSNNSAIPEYVAENCGYLASNVNEIVAAIDDLYHNPEKFLDYSKNAAAFISNKCAARAVIPIEIALIQKEQSETE